MTVQVPDVLTEALTPQWLTAALQRRFPGLEVTSVAPGPVVERISTNARFAIECAGTPPPGLFPRLCVKGYFSELGRPARAVGEAEVSFYRDLAHVSGIRTLRSVYADVDAESRHGVVITEDVVARGGEFLDGRSPYTPDQAAQSLTELARLHAATWSAPEWADRPWLRPRMIRTLEGAARQDFAAVHANYTGPNGARMPEEIRDPDRLVAAYRAVVAHVERQTESGDWCVMHGDSHVGNVFLDHEGHPCWLDWQLVQRGVWYVDVGYHIASALTVEDRRKNELDLLDHYLGRLAEFGVEPPDRDTARTALSWGIVHGLFLWSITAQVAAPIIESLLHRIGTAAADHDAFTHVLREGTLA